MSQVPSPAKARRSSPVGVSTPLRERSISNNSFNARSPAREHRSPAVVNRAMMMSPMGPTPEELAKWSPKSLQKYEELGKDRLEAGKARLGARANAIESSRHWAGNTQHALEGIDRDEAAIEGSSAQLQNVIHARQLIQSPPRDVNGIPGSAEVAASLRDKPDMMISPPPAKAVPKPTTFPSAFPSAVTKKTKVASKAKAKGEDKTVVSHRKTTKFKHSHYEYNKFVNKPAGFDRTGHLGLNLKPKSINVCKGKQPKTGEEQPDDDEDQGNSSDPRHGPVDDGEMF